jgi:hypothetical protein
VKNVYFSTVVVPLDVEWRLVRSDSVISSFSERMRELLERVEYRRADTVETKHTIYRMRHEAYLRAGSIDPQPSGIFTDPTDEAPNAFLFAVYIDGEMASSIRVHVASRIEHCLPAASTYPDIIEPLLRSGACIVDATRQVSNLKFSQLYPQLPFITMRTVCVAEDYFLADYMVAACRVEHQPAFKRIFSAVAWAPARTYPLLAKPQALMAYESARMRTTVRNRFPFFNSSSEERRRMFERSSNSLENQYDAIVGWREWRAQYQAKSADVLVAPTL